MNIYYQAHQLRCSLVTEYLEYNNIPYIDYDEWDFSSSKSVLKVPSGKFLWILPYRILDHLDRETFRNDIKDSDGIIYFAQYDTAGTDLADYKDYIDTLECEMYFHVDGRMDFLDKRIVSEYIFSEAGMIIQPRLKNTEKRDKDFLLLTVIRKDRPHRKKMVDMLRSHNLLENFVGNITDVYTDDIAKHKKITAQLKHEYDIGGKVPLVEKHVGYIGNIPGMKISSTMEPGQGFRSPSHAVPWDLYNQAHYDLVLETAWYGSTFISEKFLRPLVAEIPFVVCSNPGFYNTLHSYGFETFSNSIDESFANEPDLDTRVEKIAKAMVDCDPKQLYYDNIEKCKHNFDNLCVQIHRQRYKFYHDLDVFFEKIRLTK
mgnify:CR=1 FL=1